MIYLFFIALAIFIISFLLLHKYFNVRDDTWWGD